LYELISIKCTCKETLLILFIVAVSTSSYIYMVKMPIWSYDEKWTRWEVQTQQSVANLIPPLQLDKHDKQTNINWHSNAEQLEKYPYSMQQVSSLHSSGKGGHPSWDGSSASEFVVPVPDYELMGEIRGELAQVLQGRATQSCEKYKDHQHDANQMHSLPVMGITVAVDAPEKRYLRRLLHTIDLTTVGSIVITWYDEQTEAQIIGNKKAGSSHEVIEQTLQEYISCIGFSKIPWDRGLAENRTTIGGVSTVIDNLDESLHETRIDEPPFSDHTQLADATSLKLLSRIATSIDQFCLFEDNQRSDRKRDKHAHEMNSPMPTCRNELLVIRFSANLGCSTGVNNPLFTHPSAPHWLIVNYDIAFPPGVLAAMGKELQMAKMRDPDLAVHAYGYIYGRGKLENPWSNFVMTSCGVANVGIWDENIFPAYYEDDDYRDRIRYILGKWVAVVGDPDRHRDVPQYLMNDKHLIRYQTDRHVSVAHGPLNAATYVSGTHEMMKQESQQLWIWGKPQNPFNYESQRWTVAQTISDGEGFFECKHGALPDAGEDGQDSVRYFGWHERFLLPFVNRTRVSRMKESMLQLGKSGGQARFDDNDVTSNLSSWAVWSFNATRRKCVHEATNLILSMPPSEERETITQQFKALCSVC